MTTTTTTKCTKCANKIRVHAKSTHKQTNIYTHMYIVKSNPQCYIFTHLTTIVRIKSANCAEFANTTIMQFQP